VHYFTRGHAITEYNGSIYVTGAYGSVIINGSTVTGGGEEICYWIDDGMPILLDISDIDTSNKLSVTVSDIVVVNGTVYVAGYYRKGDYEDELSILGDFYYSGLLLERWGKN